MTRLRLIVGLAVAAVVVAACGSQGRPELSTTTAGPSTSWDAATQPATARTIPLQLRFIAKTLDGRDFRGADLVGKPAVLWFWAPWCPICQSEAPAVGKIAHSHPGVTFVGVAGLDQVRSMKEFVDKYLVKGFTQLADTGGTVWTKFGVTQQPAFAFIHPDASLYVVEGPLSEPDLTRQVAALSCP